MEPPSMISRWFRQRRNVLLPEPEGPIMATTSPLRRVSETPSSTRLSPKDLVMPWASIMTSRGSRPGTGTALLFIEFGIAFFHALEEPGQNQGHEQVKDGCHQERGGGEVALNDAARRPQNVVQGQHVNERGVLHQRDGFIAHGRQDAAHHLRQNNAAQRLQIAQAQYLAAFILAAVH